MDITKNAVLDEYSSHSSLAKHVHHTSELHANAKQI